jgi:diaminopimelate decarboxylase
LFLSISSSRDDHADPQKHATGSGQTCVHNMREFHFEQNRLRCESIDVSHLADRFGTPLYVYSAGSIRDHCRHIERAFGGFDHLSCYAIKANAHPGILSILSAEGIGADAGSIGELRLALQAGFPAERITLSGVGKTDDEIGFALRSGVLALNVESAEEMHVIRSIAHSAGVRAPVCLRFNLELEPDVHPYVATATKRSKFGMEWGAALTLLKECTAWPEIEILGIHSHIGSQIVDPATFVAAAERLVGIAGEVRALGIGLRILNFGGGFGVQYHDYICHPLLPRDEPGNEAGVTTVKLLEAILPILHRAGCRILIQPGRSIVAHGGILLSKVVYKKQNGERIFVVMDAGMNDLIRPSLYNSHHQIVHAQLEKRTFEKVDIVGPLCESGDFFALERLFPKVGRGELLAILCAGAYGHVLSSNYNGRPRPAEVLVDGDECELIRPREVIGAGKEGIRT